MVRGFYQLGSGMLTGNEILNTISNNIANCKTNGYKKQVTVGSTFEEMMLGRIDHDGIEDVGNTYMATVPNEHATIHSQGALNPTQRNLDFALVGEGFFAVERNGNVEYTRNGSFNMDGEGYLVDAQGSRVLNDGGGYIYLGQSDFSCNSDGYITVGGRTERLGVYNFDDYNTIVETSDGYYTGGGAAVMNNPVIHWKAVESSNVDMAEEMVDAIAAQRNFQSCSQALNMYSEVLDSAVNQLGKI